MSARDLILANRQLVTAAAARHGASNLRLIGSAARGDLRLIGSAARGEDRPDSDIDLLVNWEPTTSLLDHAGLMLELEEMLGRKVDIASDGWLKPRIRENVYRDAMPL